MLSPTLMLQTPSATPEATTIRKASAQMLHDLCEPLHGALFAATEIQRPEFDPAKRERYLSQLSSNLQEALQLISEFRKKLHDHAQE